MIEKLKYICAGTLALAALGMVACENTTDELDAWTDVSYVYMQGKTLGNECSKTITVIETEGLSDPTPVAYSFRVCLNRAAQTDVTIKLSAEATGGVAEILDNSMTLSAESLTIPAGELNSEEVQFTVDPAFLAIKGVQGTYQPAVFTVKVKGVEAGVDNIRVSTKTNAVVMTLRKVVNAYLNMASGTPSNAVTMNRSGWSGELGEGVEGTINNLFDGSTGSDVAANNSPWEFTLNLGASTDMLGIKTQHWGSSYSPSQIEVLTSLDGVTWKSQGLLSVSRSGTQNVKFLKPVTARYLKYRVIAPDARIDVTELNVYIAKP